MGVWKFIQKELSENNNVILITVVERNGSSPGVTGFKMAVSETGNMTGSIGGGVMEYNMVELAKKTARSNERKSFIKRQIHNPDAGEDKSGLMCSGEQTHSFTPIYKSDIDVINNILSKLDEGKNGALILNQNGLLFDEKEAFTKEINYEFTNETNWQYKEQIGIKPTLYIFGAGHVSLPLSQIFRVLNFKIVVFDDRKDLSTFENNVYAHQKHIIDFKNISDMIPEGNLSYAVIMTVNHKNDTAVLRQLITKNLKYIGMIGSKSKSSKIFETLINEGISEKELAKVDSPIGLPINSKSTAEIAISIAAKIIQIKNA